MNEWTFFEWGQIETKPAVAPQIKDYPEDDPWKTAADPGGDDVWGNNNAVPTTDGDTGDNWNTVLEPTDDHDANANQADEVSFPQF